MLEIINLKNSEPEANARLQRILGRTAGIEADVLVRAEAVVRDVRARGDAALIDYTARFDGVSLTPQMLVADRARIEEFASQVDGELIVAMREAIANIRYYHEHQKAGDWEIERANG
ncbi:MAG: histidinol dehydrogenase, partial [Acidobacteriota bacterium]